MNAVVRSAEDPFAEQMRQLISFHKPTYRPRPGFSMVGHEAYVAEQLLRAKRGYSGMKAADAAALAYHVASIEAEADYGNSAQRDLIIDARLLLRRVAAAALKQLHAAAKQEK